MTVREDMYEELLKQQAAHREEQRERVAAARRAAERQQAIDEMPRRHVAVIAAVDDHGGFSKNGEIPWYYPDDFKWFKQATANQLCLMGRLTYEDICKRRGDAAKDEVLPNRKSFVMSHSLTELNNATVVTGVLDVESHLGDDDLDKTLFVIGGERLFVEGITRANTVYLTVINKDFSCDKFFPLTYLQERFTIDKMYKCQTSPDLRFLIWKRKQGL